MKKLKKEKPEKRTGKNGIFLLLLLIIVLFISNTLSVVFLMQDNSSINPSTVTPPKILNNSNSIVLKKPENLTSNLSNTTDSSKNADISLSSDAYNLTINENLSVKVKINTKQGVYSVYLEIIYNPLTLEYLSLQKGNFLSKDGAETYEISQQKPGKIIFAATRLATTKEVSGTGNLVELKFKPLIKGETTLAFENPEIIDLSLEESKFKVTSSPGKISIN